MATTLEIVYWTLTYASGGGAYHYNVACKNTGKNQPKSSALVLKSGSNKIAYDLHFYNFLIMYDLWQIKRDYSSSNNIFSRAYIIIIGMEGKWLLEGYVTSREYSWGQ